MAGFTAAQIAVAVAATFVSAFVRGLAGFGLAILLVPVLALAMLPIEAVLVTNFLAVFIGLSEIRRLLRDAERSAFAIAALVVLTTPPGLWALAMTGADVARLLIALVALLAFAAILVDPFGGAKPGRGATGFVGVTSGLLTGYAGMPGPPVVPYYVAQGLPRDNVTASMLFIFTIAAAAGIASGAALGELSAGQLWLALALFPAVLIGNWVGKRASGRVSDRAWRIAVGLILGSAAAAALVRLL
jgi:uncharacterized membrane protein YfcA